ncbi:hypothetical protein [Mongoliitalea lutea]|uniref:Alginate export domain-containing protein n=1 Tax=Mongoliitalea lutea TaxID=849756 RepID=A0A8J3G5E9_9BACT|nr:hypothetical protein [Mongoliitalea lutea]GHB35405.1 hypothetical protein GCM10008106_16070 [Mongoliitalea lutea]
MKKLSLLLFFNFLLLTQLPAQEESSRPASPIQGTLGLRNYWMSTSYWEDFKGDFALGQSAFIRLNTQSYKGFSLATRYTVFANLWSSDLLDRDPITGNFNRYEVGLFDVVNPEKTFFGKLEELQLRYDSKKFQAILGRMDINTPFINPQDGRLSPTFIQGLQLNYQLDSKNKFYAYYIHRFSPRSTSQWFGVGESFGLYPVGQSEFGKPSGYRGNTQSEFVTILDWRHQPTKDVAIEVNNTFVDNVSNTLFSQVMKDWRLEGSKNILVSGLQVIVQNGVGNGGNADTLKRFKNPDDLNIVLSARLGVKNPQMQFFASYTRIDGRGRFLSPREWGKDPFFTFIPRERNEGFNQVNAMTLFYQRNFNEQGLQVYSFAGLHFLPDPSNISINKFAFPSYAQWNIGSRYTPQNWGNGLNFHLILMSKINLLQGEVRPQWIYNKVNLFHVNFITNYTLPWS